MSEFDAVLFDAGGVLLLPSPELTGPVLAEFGGTSDPDVLVRAHFAGAHAMDRASTVAADADWSAYARTYLAVGEVPESARQEGSVRFLEALEATWWRRPMPAAAQTLSALAGRGVPIGIVSNAAGQVEQDLAELGICGVDTPGAARVSCVVDSSVVGVSKPDPAIFGFALAALGMPASARIAYVGDTVFYDVRTAAAAGLTPLLHDPYGLHAGDPHPDGPHRVLPRLSDLLALV